MKAHRSEDTRHSTEQRQHMDFLQREEEIRSEADMLEAHFQKMNTQLEKLRAGNASLPAGFREG